MKANIICYHLYVQWVITKNELMPFAETYGPRDCHTEWSKSDRERQMLYHLYVEAKKWYKWTYLYTRKRVTDAENKLMVTKGERG